jgi:YD repeat-containing protein
MVAIVTGNGLGLERSSAWVLGSRGQVGSSGLGRDNEDLYVNAATGNLVIHGNDEILLGRFVGAQVGHSYNSLAAGGYDNGDNWMADVARKVGGRTGSLNSTGSTITRTDWDGSEEVFTWDGTAGCYLFKEGKGADDTLSFASDVWTWTDGETQTKELYDDLNGGRLTNVNSPIGFGLTYHYTGTYAAGGKLDKITTIDGDYVALNWSGNNLTQLVTHTETDTVTTTRVRYGYDGYNRLTSVTTDLSPGDNSVTDNNVYTISYTYDDTGVTAGTGKRIASVAQQDGSLIQFTYALVGSDYRVSSYTQTIAAGVTRTTSFDYSMSGRTTVTDPAGQKTILFYDSAYRLTQISYPPENGNTTPRIVQFVHDGDGNLLTARLGPGNVITYDYDHDRLVFERDSAGNTITRGYGTRNELLTETRYLVADPDGAGSGAPSAPATTHFAYDTSLRMTFAVSAEGHVTEYRYNDSGLRSIEIDYTADIYTGSDFSDSALASWAGSASKVANQRTDTTYDYRGNVSTVTRYTVIDGTSGAGVTTADYSRTTYVYDYGGRLLSRHTNADATSEVFVYDGLGRLTQATDFGGNVTRSYFLDAVGQTVLTHANGLSEVSTYDRAGELIAHSESTAGGNLVDLSGWPSNPASLPSGGVTVANWQNWSANTDEAVWASTIGPDGLPVVAMKSGQVDASNAHDVAGGGNGTNAVTVDVTKAYEFTYYFKFIDPLDRHYAFFGLGGTQGVENASSSSTANDSSAWLFYAYPPTEETNFDAGKWYKVVGYVLPQGTTTSNQLGGVYDVATGQKLLNNLATFRWDTETTTPGTIYSRFFNAYFDSEQSLSTYFYQPEIRQVSIPTALGPDSTTSLYRYDNLGRLRMTVDPTGRRNYIMYDSIGRKVADIDADGSVVEYRYDGNDNLTSTTRYATRLDSTQLASLVDANGNPTGASFASLRPATDSSHDRWTFQVYDAAQRLIQTIDGTGATSVYTYDGASRVTSTKTYANKLSSTVIANLKAEAINPNLWANPGNATLWATSNLTVAAVSGLSIEGVQAYQFSVTNANQYEAFASGSFTAKTGDTVSYTLSVEAVTGSITVDVTGIAGSSSSWGNNSDSYATIVSGPGTIGQWTGGLFTVSGLTSDGPTRITISRKLLQDESASVIFYVRSLDFSQTTTNDKVVVAAPVFTSTHSTLLNLPTADSTYDRVSRSFYDADGRVIATMDAAGGLSETVYDKAGRKIREIAYASPVTSSTRTTDDLGALRTSAGTGTADRRTDYVYDPRGLLRYTIDAAASPTEYVYDLAGRVIRTVDYAGSITAASSYSLSYVQTQLGGALGSNASNRIARTVYEANGRAAFSIDATGAVTAFTYDNVGNVIKQVGYATVYTTGGDPSLSTMQSWATSHASDTGNRISRIVYDVRGRAAYTVDAEGYVVEHRYDAAGRLARDITYATVYSVSDGATRESLATLIGSLPSTAIVTTYAYDADGLVSDVTGDVATGVTATTHFAYNGFGDVTDKTAASGTGDASTVHYSYDLVGRVDSETHGYGTSAAATTAYQYDAVGNVLVTTDPLSHVWIRTYDAVGRVLTVTAPVDSSSGNDLVTTNQYDAFGDLVKVTDPRGNASYNYYDALGRVKLQSDAETYITETSYTAFGEVYQVTRRAVRGSTTPTVTALPTIVTDAKDATTTFAYDKLSRVISVTDAEAKDEAYTYDAFGDRTKVRNKLGYGLVSTDSTYDSFATTYTFDRLGRELTEALPVSAWLASGTAQAASITTKFEYDARGNRTKLTEAYGLAEQRVTNYVYDKAGRLTDVTHDAVTAMATDLVTTSTVTPAEHYTYNLRGDLIQGVGGGKTLSWYDALGRKTDEVNAVGTLSHWTWDTNGNMQAARVYGDAVSIPSSPGGTPPSPVNSSNYRETSYGYDRSNRLTGTTIAGLNFGAFNGTAYVVTTSASLGTGLTYDKGGNVVKESDGNSNIAWTWYDKLGRKVAQVDRENYLTTWTLDANGNAAAETRYATKITGSFSETTAYTGLAALAGTNAADRTTNFTYDGNGRRLTETRLSVVASTVSSAGALSTATADATVTYTYNALGQVASKTEANGDVTDYSYDKAGRLVTVKGAAISDYAGTTVRPQTDYSYDGLGDAVRTVVRGDVYSSTTDRVTTSAYGAGGRLSATTDAVGFTRNYAYDAAGRVVKESWTRLKSDGTTNVTEAIGYRYDLAGRLVTQASAAWNGTSFTFGDATRIRYDSYGEVTGRGLTAGPSDAAVYQEVMDYDAGGRVWRTTAGDGVVKIMLYDKAGNATLTLSSTGADLSGYTAATAAATLTDGVTSIANAVTTIAVFDKRGQQTQSREPSRQLTSSTSATLVTGRAYNAFGEAASETDARSNTTTFGYSTLGRLIQKVSPIVSWTGENGTIHTTDHPTENYYYDISGRLVGVQDANNNGTTNYTTRILVAGTGHDSGSGSSGGEALVAAEFHLDGGVARTFYDAFGDARLIRDELYNSTSTTYHAASDEQRDYDKMGRVVTVVHRGNVLYDHYSYDGLGQRTGHYNNVYGSSVVERTDYDVQGRVVSQIDMAGIATGTTYSWDASLVTTGLATFGGWVQSVHVTGQAPSYDNIGKTDYFGRTVSRTDLGNHTTSYTFDYGGRLSSLTANSVTTSLAWFNTGLLASETANSLTAAYGYDEDGRRTSESYGSYQNATVTWDALGRMATYSDTGAVGGTAPASIAYEYDLNGNVRHMAASYSSLDDQGAIVGTGYSQDYWYKYDSMNRFVTTKGTFTGSRGSGSILGGTAVTYDAAGRRATTTQSIARTKHLSKYVPSTSPHTPRYYDDYASPIVPDDGTGTWSSVDWAYYSAQVETYSYTDDGFLSGVSIAVQDLAATGDNGTTSPTAGSLGSSVTRATYTDDAMGRVVSLNEYDSSGTTIIYSRSASYDAASRLSSDSVTSVVANGTGGTDTMVTATTYYYTTSGGANLLGALDRMVAANSKNGTSVSTVTTSHSYAWWDAARESSNTIATDYVTGTDTNYSSTYSYDTLGHLSSVAIVDGRSRTVSFVTDIDGKVLQRDEADSLSGGDPRELHYYFNGIQLGDVSNDGTSDVDYVTGIARHTSAGGTGPFQSGAAQGSLYVDFDQSYDPINGLNYQGAGASYTVNQGDTLQSIALGVWGDASLWYMIADANGLSGAESLAAGRTLTIPNKVTNLHNNADTFKVYDPNEALGNLSPTAVKPSKNAGHNCGIIGTILVIAVAVAITAILKVPVMGLVGSLLGSTVGAGTIAVVGAAATGAIASAASQVVGLATGMQSKFSFKGVALAALTAGITQGIGGGDLIKGAGQFVNDAARGMLANAATQGIGVATGLQDKFDWAGVAVAGVISGVGGAVSRGLDPHGLATHGAAAWAHQSLSGAASSFAGAAARSLINGSDFGDNLLAVLPDVIGSTIGNLIGGDFTGGVQGSGSRGTPEPAVSTQLQDVPLVLTSFSDLDSATNLGSIQDVVQPLPNLFAEISAAQPLDDVEGPSRFFRYINNDESWGSWLRPQFPAPEGRLLQESVERRGPARPSANDLEQERLRRVADLNGHGYRPQPGDRFLFARAIYSETGNIPEDLPAIGWTMINRVGGKIWGQEFGSTLNAVLHQRYQYQFLPEGGGPPGGSAGWQESAHPEQLVGPNRVAWASAWNIAGQILEGRLPDPTGGATHFFASSRYNGTRLSVRGWFRTAIFDDHSLTPASYQGHSNVYGVRNFFFNSASAPPPPPAPPRRH